MPKHQSIETGAISTEWDRAFDQLPIQRISQPGCCIDNRYGCLYRVTSEMLNIGGTVFHSFIGTEPWFVTRISDDYTLPLDECRIIAANASLAVNF
jgi:hypothetical protein